MADETADLRIATNSALVARAVVAQLRGDTFAGKRNVDTVLGYEPTITVQDYWHRYRRGGIAKRLVEAFPKSTWRGGAELIEDEDPTVETEFELAWNALQKRLRIWSTCQKADILSGIGRFGIILLGGPGDFASPLTKCEPNQLAYLRAFSELDVNIESYEEDKFNSRFGLPLIYNIARTASNGTAQKAFSAKVHHTRVIHVNEGALDDDVFALPRLEAVWNYLNDLVKVVGGGAEAFWKRSDRGLHVNLDPEARPSQDDKDAMKAQIDEYVHNLRRVLTTKGVDLKDLGSDVANFDSNVNSILDLVSATSGIPQRILMGSERGELASSTDQSNYDDRVEDRRNDFAEPTVVRPLVDRFIELGVLPKPAEYEVRWPELKNLDDDQLIAMALRTAQVNQAQGEIVVTSDEIREKFYRMAPLEDSVEPEELARIRPEPELEPTPDAVPEAEERAAKARRLARYPMRSKFYQLEGRAA